MGAKRKSLEHIHTHNKENTKNVLARVKTVVLTNGGKETFDENDVVTLEPGKYVAWKRMDEDRNVQDTRMVNWRNVDEIEYAFPAFENEEG